MKNKSLDLARLSFTNNCVHYLYLYAQENFSLKNSQNVHSTWISFIPYLYNFILISL